MDTGLHQRQIGHMRPRASRPDALQSATVLESLESLTAQHGAAGVPTATRSRLDHRVLTDALNALVHAGAVRRVTEKPVRLAITEAGRKRLDEYHLEVARGGSCCPYVRCAPRRLLTGH